MKKLRIIVTSVIVLAIVGSAFAFNSKKLVTFCVDSDTTAGNASECDQIIVGRFQWSIGSIFYFYTAWNGQTSTCTVPNNTNCPITVGNSIKLCTGNN
jgi:hypothetical protein